MTVELNKFVIDSESFQKLTDPLASRSIADAQTGLKDDELELLKNLTTTNDSEEQIVEIDANASVYSSKFISILNKDTSDDVVEKILYYIIKVYESKQEDELSLALLQLNKIDKSLPFSTLARYLSSSKEIIKFQASYILTALIINTNAPSASESVITQLFEVIDTTFAQPTNSDGHLFVSQLLSKLLSIKKNRELYWSSQEKYLPNAYAVLTKTTDLQLRYNLLVAIWLLTFNDKVAAKLPELYKDIIGKYLTLAKDSIKEKIARLSIATLLNFLKVSKNESIIKVFLYEKAVDTFNKLSERKWADEDLKNDIGEILEILNDAVVNLTTFDEYEIELSKKKFNWTPPHKSEEFWIDNVDKFKQNNYKIFQQLISLLEESDDVSAADKKQQELNQTIICHDLGMIVKHSPDTIKFLEKNPNLKYSIMSLMNSKNSDVKYEALKTTQILVSNSFAS